MNCYKTRYPARNVAERELKRFQNEGVIPEEVSVYHCDKCLGHHFGHNPIFITENNRGSD